MSGVLAEIDSQPDAWRRALGALPKLRAQLPAPGARLAILGCGTSYYIAQAIAAAREAAGQGESDAFPASEMPPGRTYDMVMAISRSGTTTEVVRALRALPQHARSLAISARIWSL